jgi:ornithine decarboxylase
MGGGFDCASKAEIEEVVSMGVDPAKRIIFANPCKQVSHIRYARDNGVQMVTVDNEEELIKLKKHWPEAMILIRIKTDDSKSMCQFSTKFGASLQDCSRLISLGKELDLDLVGVSFHVGSG